MAKSSFNKRHPELREGEVFISNISDSLPSAYVNDNRSDWRFIGWKTKRMGQVAYDIYGKPISDMRPVFAQRAELKEAGVNPDRLS